MKKIFICSFLVVLISCKCISQLPTQVIYTSQNCQASLPDYTKAVSVSDNCRIVSFTQSPLPGYILDKDNLQVTVRLSAKDISGNESISRFNVILLDTISPVFHYPDSMLSYSPGQVSDMYLVFESWQKENIMDFMNYFHWPVLNLDTIKYSVHYISIPDSIYQAYLKRQ